MIRLIVGVDVTSDMEGAIFGMLLLIALMLVGLSDTVGIVVLGELSPLTLSIVVGLYDGVARLVITEEAAGFLEGVPNVKYEVSSGFVGNGTNGAGGFVGNLFGNGGPITTSLELPLSTSLFSGPNASTKMEIPTPMTKRKRLAMANIKMLILRRLVRLAPNTESMRPEHLLQFRYFLHRLFCAL